MDPRPNDRGEADIPPELEELLCLHKKLSVHVVAGVSLILQCVLLAIGAAPILWVLNASAVLLAVSVGGLPWLSPWIPRIEGNTVRARLAIGLFTGSLVPLLIAVPIVLAPGQVAASTKEAAFGITVLLSICAAIGGWQLARYLTTSLSRLVAGVGRIGTGAESVRLVSGAPEEVDELACAVEAMAGKLDEQMHEIKDTRDQHRAVAEKLQHALQMTTGLFPGLDLAHAYQSATELAELGGDFFDVFRVPGGRVGIVIGDVSGKGLDAAAQAVLMRTSLRAFTYSTDSPAEVLARANALLLDMNAGGFVSAFFGVLDPGHGDLVCCSAGHPPAILIASSRPALLDGASPVLGVFKDAVFKETRLHFNAGDTLLLYTDGLTEARRDGVFFGEANLLRHVESLAALPPLDLVQSLYSQVLDFADGSLGDDLALLAVRLQPATAASSGQSAGA